MSFAPARFDLVVSVLALHYVDDYRRLVARIAEWLVPGGVVVYSTEHPILPRDCRPTAGCAGRRDVGDGH